MKRLTVQLPVWAMAFTAFMGSAAQGQEYQPYPSPRVTVEQWSQYLAIVQSRFASSAEVFREKKVVAFNDPATGTYYIFTTKGHAAHPAWVTRQIVEEGGQVSVRQIGYFAGDEEPFAKLFAEYQQMNEKLREDVQRRNQ